MLKRILFVGLALAVFLGFSAYKNFLQFSADEKERSAFTSALNGYINTPFTWAETSAAKSAWRFSSPSPSWKRA